MNTTNIKTTDYEIRLIPTKSQQDLILNKHYQGRFCSISYQFGLFLKDSTELLGVVTYGTPPSPTLRTHLCGENYKVLELNRLVLKHNIKNEQSILVGASLKLLKEFGEFVVVSYQDTSRNHTGYVYQACNFLYTGLSQKKDDYIIKGMEHKHNMSITDEFRGVPNRTQAMKEKYGDSLYTKERPRKHRYVIFVGSRNFKKRALRDLRYAVENYPKSTEKSPINFPEVLTKTQPTLEEW